MDPKIINDALAKVGAKGLPGVSIENGAIVLRYEGAAYEARVSADLAAIGKVVTIVSSSVTENYGALRGLAAVGVAPAAQVVKIVARPIASK